MKAWRSFCGESWRKGVYQDLAGPSSNFLAMKRGYSNGNDLFGQEESDIWRYTCKWCHTASIPVYIVGRYFLEWWKPWASLHICMGEMLNVCLTKRCWLSVAKPYKYADQLGKDSKSPQSSKQRPDPAPQFEKQDSRSQLEESRKLNSEGLEVTLFLAF